MLRKPLITTFRALTDNDRGAGHAFERAQWAVAGKYARCVDTKVEPLGETAVSVTYTYELAIAQRTKVTIRYVADVLGHVDLHVAYPGEKDGDRRRFRRSALNGCCRSSIRICDSMA